MFITFIVVHFSSNINKSLFTFFNSFLVFYELLLYTVTNSTKEGGGMMDNNQLIALLVMLVIVLTKGNDNHEN